MVLFWRGNQSVNEAERSTVQSSEEKQGKGVLVKLWDFHIIEYYVDKIIF